MQRKLDIHLQEFGTSFHDARDKLKDSNQSVFNLAMAQRFGP